MPDRIPTSAVFASLAGCQPDELINFRTLEDGSAVAILPTGQKFKYTAEHLAAQAARLAAVETKSPDHVQKPVTKKGRGGSSTRPNKK